MTSESEYKGQVLHTIVKYFSLCMSLVYPAIGIAVLWNARELNFISPSYAIPFGIVMIAYGVFRGYQVYQKYF